MSGSISSLSVCLFKEGLQGRPQLGWESDDLDLVLQVPRTFNVRTVRVRVDVLKPLDDDRNEFLCEVESSRR